MANKKIFKIQLISLLVACTLYLFVQFIELLTLNSFGNFLEMLLGLILGSQIIKNL